MSLERTRAYRYLFKAVASLMDLPPWLIVQESRNPEEQRMFLWPSTWLEGLIQVESAGDLMATRYEPGLDRRVGDPDTPGVDDDWKEDSKSYGWMQVLGTNIRWAYSLPKIKMDYKFATNPMPNLDVGCFVLKHFLNGAEGDVPKALAMYNMGYKGGDLLPNGKLRNQAYVDKVQAKAIEVFRDLKGAPR